MWGDVTPAERLRAVTRRHLDDDRLAVEAAGALAGFAAEPASLVVACRQLLVHHCSNGALWWVCARILAAPEPERAAREAAQLLEADRTADRLGATLPLLDEGEVVAVVGWPEIVDTALVERFDVEAVAIRVDGADPTSALRHRHSDHNIRVVDSWDPVLARVAVLIVAASAIGADRALVPAGTRAALDEIAGAARQVWMIGGVGRVLPARLYEVVGRSSAGDDSFEELALARVDRIAGPRGVERVDDAVGRIDCPVVPELLKDMRR
jgi:hypothetical protein